LGITSLVANEIKALGLEPGFTVCELGNQVCRFDKHPPFWAKGWYKHLGCGEYVSLDLNGEATHQVDLNYPIPYDIGQFDLVTDFGCGEHLFNQAQVFTTLHDLCKVGGYIAIDRPKNDFEDHGFYLVQNPLLLDICEANGYGLVTFQPYTLQKNTTEGTKTLGEMLFCVFKKLSGDKFMFPNQGKYQERANLPCRSERK
jgi:hypothetical protein